MKSSLQRFKERNAKRMVANNELNSRFILNGYPATTITIEGNVEDDALTSVQAAVVNKQEQDKAYFYTFKKDQLPIGSVWRVKDALSFIITEEIITIKEVGWRKYTAFRCNVDIDGQKGYFIGPEKSYINVNLTNDLFAFSQQKPVLVLPSNDVLNIGDKVVINQRAWKINEFDAISTNGITYYSLVPTSVSKEVTDIGATVEKAEVVELDNEKLIKEKTHIEVSPNSIITLPTEGGYFDFNNKNIKIVSRTTNQVQFKLPFGVSEAIVSIKKKGLVVHLQCKVVNE